MRIFVWIFYSFDLTMGYGVIFYKILKYLVYKQVMEDNSIVTLLATRQTSSGSTFSIQLHIRMDDRQYTPCVQSIKRRYHHSWRCFPEILQENKKVRTIVMLSSINKLQLLNKILPVLTANYWSCSLTS